MLLCLGELETDPDHTMGLDKAIRTTFDERKTTAAAAYLLKLAGGRMSIARLMTLLYMADRESWRLYGRPITGDTYRYEA